MNGLHDYDTPSLNGALGASATHNGVTYDTGGSPSAVREFGAIFGSTAASAANGAKIQASFDGGTTWVDVAVATLAAGVPQTLVAPIVAKHMRAQLVNAAGAATATVVAFRRRN